MTFSAEVGNGQRGQLIRFCWWFIWRILYNWEILNVWLQDAWLRPGGDCRPTLFDPDLGSNPDLHSGLYLYDKTGYCGTTKEATDSEPTPNRSWSFATSVCLNRSDGYLIVTELIRMTKTGITEITYRSIMIPARFQMLGVVFMARESTSVQLRCP